METRNFESGYSKKKKKSWTFPWITKRDKFIKINKKKINWKIHVSLLWMKSIWNMIIYWILMT